MTPRTPGASAARPPGAARGARGGEPTIPPVPGVPLLVAGPFARLPARAVASAIASGLRAGGWAEADVCGLEDGLGEPDFDARMRRARAVVIAQRRLTQAALRGSAAFEIATRARQAGVPCFAVTARNGLSALDARILDLQLVLEAGDLVALDAAGRRLAEHL